VTPPTVNKNKKPKVNNNAAKKRSEPPQRVASQLKILIPVGIAIIIVAALKYARESTSIPTVNI